MLAKGTKSWDDKILKAQERQREQAKHMATKATRKIIRKAERFIVRERINGNVVMGLLFDNNPVVLKLFAAPYKEWIENNAQSESVIKLELYEPKWYSWQVRKLGPEAQKLYSTNAKAEIQAALHCEELGSVFFEELREKAY